LPHIGVRCRLVEQGCEQCLGIGVLVALNQGNCLIQLLRGRHSVASYQHESVLNT
jgi:hypothetical protein